ALTTDDYLADMKAAARLLAADAAADWLFLLPNLVVVKAGLTGVAANATSLSFDVTTIAGKG
ncbi:MAG: ABC transporter substrate-binding protein, partial [Propionibacteriaceae bacterium]|nr:ABC transporter substrate-binding protein [Propionibacteriaceae bacterium]